jgi:deazaflavin-dependent oxidoreductase (nitroreductase family)
MPNLDWARPAVSSFSRSRFFRAVGPTIMPPLEAVMRVLTRGRVQLSGLLVPTLVLHSIGAKSGLERDSTLMFCPDGDTMLVTGSNFARENHPAWTANLLAHPDVAVSVRGRRIRVHAHRIADDELDDTWATIQRQWPNYRQYEVQAGRTLRIFRLVPALRQTR